MEVTACITTYNRPDYLHESLESLYNQSSNKFEILILDNDSTNETKNVVNKFIDLTPKLRYIKHKEMPIPEQRNLALSEVNTNFIGFLDDDDLWSPKKIETFLNDLHNRQPLEIALWYSGFKFFSSKRNNRRHFSDKLFDKNSDLRSLLLQRGDFCASASNPIVNVEKAKSLGGYKNSILTGEDFEFYLRLAREYQFTSNKEALTFVRNHRGSRLGGRLRDYIRTDIDVYRSFNGIDIDIDEILTRKIATKLIRINKNKTARKIIKISIKHWNRESFINTGILVLSFFNKEIYSWLHFKTLIVLKKIRRLITIN